MRDINVLISNGTCYYDSGRQSSGNIIPCGNAAYGVYACCQEGDICLDQSICYYSDQRTTYMAGCTDPEYSDSSCPHKDNSGQQLLGLVQCSGSGQAGGTALWSACPGPTTKTALGAPSQCSCAGTAAGLLWMTTSLSALATLPAAAGGTIRFNDGHYPTVKTSGTAARAGTSTVPPGASTTRGSQLLAPPTATHPAPANSTAGRLSTGAEVGIGIGATLVGLCAIGLAIFAMLIYRRKPSSSSSSRKGKTSSLATAENGGHVSSPANDTNSSSRHGEFSEITHLRHHHPSSPGSLCHNNNVPYDDDGTAWHAYYTGYKSELPAHPEHSHRSELPADVPPTTTTTTTTTAWQPPHTRVTAELLVSPLSSSSSYGGWENDDDNDDGQRTGRPSPRPVSEMSSHLGLSSTSRSWSRSSQQVGEAGWHGGARGLAVSSQDGRGDGDGALEVISELHG